MLGGEENIQGRIVLPFRMLRSKGQGFDISSKTPLAVRCSECSELSSFRLKSTLRPEKKAAKKTRLVFHLCFPRRTE